MSSVEFVQKKNDENISLKDQDPKIINKAIHDAFKEKNADKSRDAHIARFNHDRGSSDEENVILELQMEEQHKSLGDYVKSIIYGALDGIISTFAIVAAIQGAEYSTEYVLVLGFANLIADGLSMGVADYLSEKSELEYINSEKNREEWEYDNFIEGEIQEMIEIYRKHNISSNDSELIIRTMAKYKDFFINHMMVQELELQPTTGHKQPIKSGAVTLISFLCFGCIPLLSYIAFSQIDFDGYESYDPKFIISIILTAITLFCLGVFKGKLTESSMIKSGLFITINGCFAAAVAYGIAKGLNHIIQ